MFYLILSLTEILYQLTEGSHKNLHEQFPLVESNPKTQFSIKLRFEHIDAKIVNIVLLKLYCYFNLVNKANIS